MTSGVSIVGSLLRAHTDLGQIVPVTQIKAAALPDNIPLPAILVRTVSSVDRQPLKRSAKTRTVDRVAVTVRASSYREQCTVIGMIKDCCGGITGEIDGAERVAILTAGTGPDVRGPGDSFEQTQDLRVSYDA